MNAYRGWLRFRYWLSTLVMYGNDVPGEFRVRMWLTIHPTYHQKHTYGIADAKEEGCTICCGNQDEVVAMESDTRNWYIRPWKR